MSRYSRRGFLAAAGSALLAGCSLGDGPDRETVTPYNVTVTGRRRAGGPSLAPGAPDPLGTRAVPPDADPLPDPGRELELDTSASRAPVGAVLRPDSATVVANTWTAVGPGSPVGVSLTGDGAVTAREPLEGLPSLRLSAADAAGDGLAVAGGADDPWVRAYRGDSERYQRVAPEGVGSRIAALEPHDGGLVLAGLTSAGAPAATRLGPDGERRWTTALPAGFEPRALAATPQTVLIGGTERDRAQVVAVAGDGGARWSSGLVGGPREYAVQSLASGQSGTYALVGGTGGSGRAPPAVFAFDSERVRWVRMLGRSGTERSLRGGSVVDRNGPVVTAHAPADDAAWIASFTPRGEPSWAGYYRFRDRPTRSVGLAAADRTVLSYGIAPSSHVAERSNVWLAWL